MTVSITTSSVYPCDSDSVIKQISYAATADGKVTCNGIIVDGPYDSAYDVIYNKHGKWGNGNWGTKQTLKLTNYTEVATFNNGMDIIEEIP